MARSSRGSSRSYSSTSASAAPHRAPAQQHHAPPPPQYHPPAPQQPSLFKQVAATATGVAVGSAVGHAIGRSMVGGNSGHVQDQQQQQYGETQYQQQQQSSGFTLRHAAGLGLLGTSAGALYMRQKAMTMRVPMIPAARIPMLTGVALASGVLGLGTLVL
ncbi:hypothetical protein BC828DRAFT_23467 [Blastocladiella britannica]|nr:hypothetical protein BC828DRAFT_23467 [Blastocladiella britannica]